MTVGDMLKTMTSYELTEWMVYSGIEPFGEERADLRSAIISSTIVNVNRGKGGKTYKPVDFMPFFDRHQTWQEQLSTVEVLAGIYGGKVENGS